MDTPELNRIDERGLPSYSPHIERQITNVFLNGLEPSPEMEQTIDRWIWTRAKACRERNATRPPGERKAPRLPGWRQETGKSKKRKSHRNGSKKSTKSV